MLIQELLTLPRHTPAVKGSALGELIYQHVTHRQFRGQAGSGWPIPADPEWKRLGPGAKVVTLMADSGLKYLSTDVYRRSPRETTGA